MTRPAKGVWPQVRRACMHACTDARPLDRCRSNGPRIRTSLRLRGSVKSRCSPNSKVGSYVYGSVARASEPVLILRWTKRDTSRQMVWRQGRATCFPILIPRKLLVSLPLTRESLAGCLIRWRKLLIVYTLRHWPCVMFAYSRLNMKRER